MNIPSLPIGQFLNKDKTDMDDNWRQFFDQLIQELQKNAGTEGLVSPTQTAANKTIIQNNQLQNLSYSCQYGTSLYNSTANSIMFTVNDGTGKPIFRTVTLT